MKHLLTYIFLLFAATATAAGLNVSIKTQKGEADNRVLFAAEHLASKLQEIGMTTADGRKDYVVELRLAKDTAGLRKEGYRISVNKKKILVEGYDGSGVIYGAVAVADYARQHDDLSMTSVTESPEMVLRGGCVGIQKTYFLPGRQVYEYPYTPENFPWFYDKEEWVRYLDMLVDNRMNSLYLWNGHPFASLVKLEDYPFAVEVDDETFKKNEEMYSFLTHEADRRGIFVIQMFYNILLSKPFADHYGLKTQDRNRPITPLISDYTRKSVAAFIEKYPNVGLLVCLGEAMATYEDDVEWMTKTIIPGVKDGLQALGRTDEPPILLRAHDTDCKAVMEASLPIYKNLYTMHKYNGESLTTTQPHGPWAKLHQDLAALGSTHIENVHILANLEPMRWASPSFIQRTMQSMHAVHHANALHLYPQASYWDWPYTADKLQDGSRLKQLDRDWMWFKAWGRYAWKAENDTAAEADYWAKELRRYYGMAENSEGQRASRMMLDAICQSGEVSPALAGAFAITDGNRQTFMLGMKMAQLVNPFKYTVYPEFYASCGPLAERLIDFVEKSQRGEATAKPSVIDITARCVDEAGAAAQNVAAVGDMVTPHRDEYLRWKNDIHCIKEFAKAFKLKVEAAQHVLNYKYNDDVNELHRAVELMEQAMVFYRNLVDLTRDTYHYANSMQTSMRRVPIAGDDGKYKHWTEMVPVYEQELANLKKNIAQIEAEKAGTYVRSEAVIKPLQQADITFTGDVKQVKVEKGARLFNDLDSVVVDYATELDGLTALQLSANEQRKSGTELTFDCAKAITLLVGYYRDDQMKYAQAPRLETDASANDYGQAEPLLTSAIRIDGMPQVNVHAYSFAAGHHTIRLPKGMLVVLGATSDKAEPRDAGLAGESKAIDWLFY